MAPEWAHIPKYPLSEFKVAILLIGVFLGYKIACKAIFFDWVKERLDPKKFPTEEERNTRAKTGCVWIGNIIYYTLSTVTCFLLFREEDFFPKSLGGKGDVINMFTVAPYRKDVPNGILFYMIQLGNHLHTIIDYCVYKWNTPKFWEMFLHHCMAVFLMVFSYMTNNIPFGILVLFVHDPCDVFLCSSRLIGDMTYQPKVLRTTNYILFIVSWIFFRLYAFPKYIVGAGFDYFLTHDYGMLNSPFLFLFLMMAALVILHAYWFLFIFRILIAMISGKANYNVYDNSKGKKK